MEDLTVIDGLTYFYFTDEASVRDSLARIAYLAGWDVETEHHVPGWGRPDLYLRGPKEVELAVELKVRLTRAADIRKGFQQAHAYSKALGPLVQVILAAPVIDMEKAKEYQNAFYDVELMTTDTLAAWLNGALEGLRERHLIAWERYEELERQIEISRGVLARLARCVESPLGAPVTDPPTEDAKAL